MASRYHALVEELARDGVRLAAKAEAWHQRALHHLLCVATFGGQRRYLQDYVTTIGRTIYLPPDWERRPLDERWATLRHERVHVEQFRRWGIFCMTIAYLVIPLPLGLAYCRMRLERAAYAETVRAHFQLGGRAATDALRAHVIAQFTSGSYGWMWPFPRAVARWYDALVDELAAGA